MMRVGFRGDKNTTITRFLSGLSLHIIDRVEFFYLIEIWMIYYSCIMYNKKKFRKYLSNKEKAHSKEYHIRGAK